MSITSSEIKVTASEVEYFNNSPDGITTSGFTIRREFTNYTKNDIYLKTQSNLPIIIEPHMGSVGGVARPHLEIKTVYMIHGLNGFNKTRQLLDQLERDSTRIMSPDARHTLKKMEEAIKNKGRINGCSNFTATTYQIIPDQELQLNDLVYVREADVIISFRKDSVLKPHPNSSAGYNQTEAKQQGVFGMAGTFVKVVDSTRRAPSWFYYSGKNIIEVPAIQDESLKDGVYVTTFSVDNGVFRPIDETLGFEEAGEKIGLYRTRAEAISAGDPAVIHEREIADFKRREQDLKRENLELESRLKRETGQAVLDQKSALHVIERNGSQEELDRKRQAAALEERTTTLKFFGDLFKSAALLVVAAIGFFSIFSKRSAA